MNEHKSELIDIRRLVCLYKSNWRLFAVSVLICLCVGILVAVRMQPKFESNASMMLNQDQQFTSMIAGGLSGVSDLLGGNSNGEDEVQVVGSHSSLSSVSSQLGLSRMHYKKVIPTVYTFLYDDYPVDVIPGKDIDVDTLKSSILCVVKVSDSAKASLTISTKGEELYSGDNLTMPVEVSTEYGTFTLAATEHFKPGKSFKNKIIIRSNSSAAQELKEVVNIGLAAKNSQIIELQMYSANTKYSIDVLNAIMSTYLERHKSNTQKENTALLSFLNSRINSVKVSLESSERELTDIKEASGITGLTTTSEAANERLVDAEEKMTSARLEHELAVLTLNMVKETAKDNSLIPIQGGATEAAIISSYNNLIYRRAAIEQSAKPDNSALQRLDNQITQMRNNLISTLEVKVKRTKELQDKHEAIFKQMTDQIEQIPQLEYDLHDMYRKRTINEEIYLFLVKKLEETSMLMGTIDEAAEVVDPAYAIYEDKSMSPIIIVVLAMFFGLFIPPVWLYLFKAKCNKKDEEDSKRLFNN